MLLGMAFARCGVAPDDRASLEARVAASNPQWESYTEDIKGQIGATPVASWQGEPALAEWDGNRLFVDFKLSGGRPERTVAIPVLVRGPRGNVYVREGAERTTWGWRYVFSIPEAPSDTPPWIEVKFPGGERRLMLDSNGRWQNP